jgi:hypothetical protein
LKLFQKWGGRDKGEWRRGEFKYDIFDIFKNLCKCHIYKVGGGGGGTRGRRGRGRRSLKPLQEDCMLHFLYLISCGLII